MPHLAANAPDLGQDEAVAGDHDNQRQDHADHHKEDFWALVVLWQYRA